MWRQFSGLCCAALWLSACGCPSIDQVAVSVSVIDAHSGKSLCTAGVTFDGEPLPATGCMWHGGEGLGRHTLTVAQSGYETQDYVVDVEERCGGDEKTVSVTIALVPQAP